jgi:hypothetical protein
LREEEERQVCGASKDDTQEDVCQAQGGENRIESEDA